MPPFAVSAERCRRSRGRPAEPATELASLASVRVLISTPFLGGVGGLERNVASTIAALAEDDVDVCTARRIKGGFTAEPSGAVIPYRRVLPYRRIPSPFASSPCAGPTARRCRGPSRTTHTCTTSPAGTSATSSPFARGCSSRRERRRLVGSALRLRHGTGTGQRAVRPRSIPSVALLPPVMAAAESQAPGEDLPDQYVLTVFNAYHGIKGGELMRDVATACPFPIVWCFSRRTRHYDVAPYAHDDIVTIEDATSANLRWLYEHAAAYVLFSRTEGFGWAIADALQYGTPVISRRTGVLSLDGIDLRVSTYEDRTELARLLEEVTPADPAGRFHRDLDFLRPARFRERLHAVVAG